MKKYGARYDSEGRIRQVGKYSENLPASCVGVVDMDEPINPNNFYVDLDTFEVLPYPVKPTPRATWSGTLKQWVLDLETERTAKLDEIRVNRNNSEPQGFEYLGKQISNDLNNTKRITAAVLVALTTSGNFTAEIECLDGTYLVLDKTEVLGLPTAMNSVIDIIQKKAKKLKKDIADATTVDDVLSIKW